jgi:tRNA A37 threonylcarbamoyladenosine dehydratase
VGIDFSKFDYIVDAIDTISGKFELIKKAKENNVPIICCMGTGNKLDERAFKVTDISKTKVCPLCKVMRKLLKENGIENVKVVYSEEEPILQKESELLEKKGKGVSPSSISFVPAVAGLMLASEVVKDLLKV